MSRGPTTVFRAAPGPRDLQPLGSVLLNRDRSSAARVPEQCRHREPLGAGTPDLAVCGVLRRIARIDDPAVCQVRRDACNACCQSLRDPGEVNPVIASLLYSLATRIAARGGHPECTAPRAATLQRCARDQLSVIVRELPGQSFPPAAAAATGTEAAASAPPRAPRTFRWALGLLTAPRAKPRIEGTLDSLARAGFADLQIFAEPGAWIPPRYAHLPVARHRERLGNFLNFYSALSELLRRHPCADAFAVFQDDIELAQGSRTWCEQQLWPAGCGVVSLFTPRLHEGETVGWRVLSPGFQRVCGAQALVFRRDLLERFLADARVVHNLNHDRHGDDAILGGWLGRQGLGIGYHTPSLVQHVGDVSSIFAEGPDRRNVARAVDDVADISGWETSPSRLGQIGLVGWNTRTGLGSLNRDLAAHLQIRRWLVPPHPQFQSVAEIGRAVEMISKLSDHEDLRAWTRGLDWLLFAERPYLPILPRLAAHAGVGIACIPMWEWVRPDLDWLPFVDLMICPTRLAYLQMQDWAQRYGFGWKSIHVPWPVDSRRFEFRQRRVCREFLFVNGWGGGRGHYPDGSPTPYRRKGFELIRETAAIAPDLRFVVRSLEALPALPRNVRVAPALADNSRLYDEGDVCVQPSHYEGLGLQLLECQAAGLPLVTTSAAPMNETRPWRTIPSCGREVISVGEGFLPAELMSPHDLAATLRPLVGADLLEASRSARDFVETDRGWDQARRLIHAELVRR